MESRLPPDSAGEGGSRPRASRRPGLVNVSTITVAKPTAAEHTMQPASISENSRRSLAACISCKAHATNATTLATMPRAIAVEAGGGRAGRAVNTRRERSGAQAETGLYRDVTSVNKPT